MIIVEGCFDVAKLVEADIKNVVSSFGSYLYQEQKPKLQMIKECLDDVEFLVWYDRVKAGEEGRQEALNLLEESGFKAKAFDWDMTFQSDARENIRIPKEITELGKLSVGQLRF